MIVINRDDDGQRLAQAARAIRAARLPLALTGAGISVGSGIPDFRSPGGLWKTFPPEEYATLEAFFTDPAKAWKLYRALGRVLLGKKANSAHRALAELETKGLLHGIVTQNVDGLHQQAGSRTIFEIHGEHHHLHCLQCGALEPVTEEHLQPDTVPGCRTCAFPLKPNVVLFGEPVRSLAQIDSLVGDCDLLLVVGTSAQVYPAAGLVPAVKRNGGIIFEFNREQTAGEGGFGGFGPLADYFFQGDAGEMLPLLCRALEQC